MANIREGKWANIKCRQAEAERPTQTEWQILDTEKTTQ